MTAISIPQVQADALSHTLLDAIRRFYADPINLKRFEQWRAVYAATTKEANNNVRGKGNS